MDVATSSVWNVKHNMHTQVVAVGREVGLHTEHNGEGAALRMYGCDLSRCLALYCSAASKNVMCSCLASASARICL